MATDKSKKIKTGSAFDLLGKSLEIVKNNWQIFAIVNVFGIFYAVMEALNLNDSDTNKHSGYMFNGSSDFSGFELSTLVGGGLLIFLVFLAVSFFFFVMSTSLEVKSTSGKQTDFNSLFEDGKKFFFPLLGLVIIMASLILIGLLLLIVPGIIAIGRLAMAPYIMVDKKIGIEEALKESNALGKKYFGEIWAAILVTILISILAAILGAIPLLGPLAAVAVSIAYSLVLALRYQQLKGRTV